jgi:hypothetical protein
VTRALASSALLAAALLAGCASVAPPPEPLEEFPPPSERVTVAPRHAPLVESPPLEPVEPPLPPPSAAPPERTVPPPAPTTAPAPGPAPAPVIVPVEPPEDATMVALLADLSRYNSLGSDELRREVAVATQALNRTRTDANRIRLAVLYTLARSNSQDDQRALQLFDNVARSGGPPTPVKNLAAVLQAQVTERQRAVRDEQQKGEQAVRKLDQLLEMERALLRDRVRSGGGGGGGGGAGGSGH